jgi:hypothetical protein
MERETSMNKEYQAMLKVDSVYNAEFKTEIGINYLGRIDFGQGNIDASDVEQQAFTDHIQYIGSEGLVYAADLSELYSGCIDGRPNIQTISGKPVRPRSKVIGGNTLFGWNVAAMGNYSLLAGVDDPLEQFRIVSLRLKEAGFRLGMHLKCGAAGAVEPVAENYLHFYDKIHGLSSQRTRSLLTTGQLVTHEEMRVNIEKTQNNLHGVKNFNEEEMHKVVMELDGRDAIIQLDERQDHENHGHEEIGLLKSFVRNAVIFKDRITEQTGRQVFYQDMVYAQSIVDVLARTPHERARGTVIADHLPLAGVTTLGNNQHVGEIHGALTHEFNLAA